MTEQTGAVRFCLSLLLLTVAMSACSSTQTAGRSVGSPSDDPPVAADAPHAADSVGSAVTNTTPIGPSAIEDPLPSTAFNDRVVPRVATSAQEAASLFAEVQAGLRAEDQQSDVYGDLGHTEQLVIRQLVRNEEWIDPFRAALSAEDLALADLHLTARRELSLLHAHAGDPSPDIPAWTIIEPEPLETLVGHYKRAGEASGVDWRVLAGINLIETGMGRILGLSSGGAQGPMQFLPTTWAEVSEGGDINDPSDAIDGAARYLVQRGGLDDIRQGLFGYNNSDNYVNAVLAYAALLELDERAIRGFYNWEVYVGTAAGTLWLPVGYLSPEPTPAIEYAEENPWALTLG